MITEDKYQRYCKAANRLLEMKQEDIGHPAVIQAIEEIEHTIALLHAINPGYKARFDKENSTDEK